MSRVDCVIKDWELVTFKSNKMLVKVVRGIILEDYNRPFEPGYWVCSTPVIYEDMEQKIVQTNNTVYKLLGNGEHYETDNFTVYAHMQGGLTFNQAMWAIALETKVDLESEDGN